jgi:hypothetical protein
MISGVAITIQVKVDGSQEIHYMHETPSQCVRAQLSSGSGREITYVNEANLYLGIANAPVNARDAIGLFCVCCKECDRGATFMVITEYRCMGKAGHPDASGKITEWTTVTGIAGLTGPGPLDCIAGLPSLPSVVDLYVELIAESSGNFSGYNLWIKYQYYKCKSRACLLPWSEHLLWRPDDHWWFHFKAPGYTDGSFVNRDACIDMAKTIAE